MTDWIEEWTEEDEANYRRYLRKISQPEVTKTFVSPRLDWTPEVLAAPQGRSPLGEEMYDASTRWMG